MSISVDRRRARSLVERQILIPELKTEVGGGGICRRLNDRVVQAADLKGNPQWIAFRYLCHSSNVDSPDFMLAMACLHLIREHLE